MDHQEMADVESQNLETPPDVFLKGKHQVTLKVCMHSKRPSIFPYNEWSSCLVYSFQSACIYFFSIFLSLWVVTICIYSPVDNYSFRGFWFWIIRFSKKKLVFARHTFSSAFSFIHGENFVKMMCTIKWFWSAAC